MNDIHAWLIRYIQRQRFVDSLQWVAEQIRLDTVDGFEYTKDAEQMQLIRNAWGEQMEFARAEE